MSTMEHIDKISSYYYNENPYILEVEFRSRFIADALQARVAGCDVLDLGIGHGLIIETLASKARSYDIVEGSKIIIEQYMQTHCLLENTTITHAYFEVFDKKKKYDFILMNSVLMFLEDPLSCLCRYRSFMKSSATLIVSVPNAATLNRRIGLAMGTLPSINALNPLQLEKGHRHYFTLETITEQLTQAGYKVQRVRGIFLKPITTAQMKALDFTQAHYEALMRVGEDFPTLCNHLFLECAL